MKMIHGTVGINRLAYNTLGNYLCGYAQSTFIPLLQEQSRDHSASEKDTNKPLPFKRF